MKRSAFVLALVATSACSFDTWRFYDVVRTPTDVCEIRPEGEFCDPDIKPPPENEGWSIERQDDQVRIYVDDEVWIAAVNEDDPNKLSAKKLEVTTADPGPCTTTHERKLSTTDDGNELSGKLEDKIRTTGDECGGVRGSRTTYSIKGTFSGSP